jgi:CDP-diacylglycerol--serine O-phosphatidyltransferase
MRHLPNLLTLANLFFGCCAIAMTLSAQNFSVLGMAGDPLLATEVPATEQAYWGSLFIGLAAVCDMLDGAVARALKVHSPIGADLDSLADVVSFGVAPAMMLYKMLWAAAARQPDALDVSLWSTFPAFLIAAFAALRLARFNVSAPRYGAGAFEGMPTPAVGLFVASLPLVQWYNPMGLGPWLFNRWLLLGIIALLCWAMVSKVRFLKGLPASWKPAQAWPQIVLVIAAIALIPVMGWAAAPVVFLLYILLSFVAPKPATSSLAPTAPDGHLADAQP